ncbi:hypothetical protein QVD17_31519 [Tagetes erecta]|uniref:Uncharacterized protein n=1 Tax=Tagetes erecta TaxID=13708 RepID=A0AAD8K3J3_TARER|nr:hypothetical protein QVD17_31519 [Tagetes erecta]
MSIQQADQTPLVYPVSETSPPSHSQSDGSFRAVFIVLGVIVAVSAIACFLGRMCSKRYNKSKPYKRGRRTKERDMNPNRNAFETKDGDIEFGYDKRFSSAKVAANGEPNMAEPNLFREPNMGEPNSLRDPNMGGPNSFPEPNMGPSMGGRNFYGDPNMGPDMGGPNSFPEPNMGRPNMGPNMGRPNSFRESNMDPSLGRPNSFRESSMGRPDTFHEASMGRPNSFRKGDYRDDEMRVGGNEDHEMKYHSRTRPQYY